MRIMLILPPQYDPVMPSLALPCLSAALKDAGHKVLLKDVNIESFDYFLSKEGLFDAREKLYLRRNSLTFLGVDPKSIDIPIKVTDRLAEEVEEAKKTLKTPETFFNYSRYKNAIDIIKESLSFVSLPQYGCRLSVDSLKLAYSPDSTNQILQAVKDEFCNPYIDYYKRYTIPDIVSKKPEIIGISISLEGQIIPALTLSYMLKKEMDVHIVIGGSYFTLLEGNLTKNHELFTLFDSVILYEGETALCKLAESIENKKSFAEVPNLIYKEGREIVSTGIFHTEDVSKLPTPDFEGMPLTLYLSPCVLLPLYTSRGCYWNKCTFCNFHIAAGNKYRTRPVQKVLKDIKALKMNYGSDSFIFVDEAITHSYMEEFSDAIIKDGIDINWLAHARFEKQIDNNLCKKVFKAGCKMLAFGLESACDRVLKLMKKGTNVETITKVLTCSSEAGIKNHISFFVGFPTETRYEANETVKFVLDNLKNLSSVKFGYFLLKAGSPVHLNPSEYKITEVAQNKYEDLSITYNFHVSKGITQEEAIEFTQELCDIFGNMGNSLVNSHLGLYAFYYESGNILWLDEILENSTSGV